MSEAPTPSGSVAPPEGQATSPDSSSSASPASSLPETQVQEPTQDRAGGVVAVPQEPGENAGKSLGENAPSLADLQNQQCPNCTVGVLYVKRYDPDALHEAGQDYAPMGGPPALPRGFESGGSYEVECAYCNWSHSFAMNPGQYHGRSR